MATPATGGVLNMSDCKIADSVNHGDLELWIIVFSRLMNIQYLMRTSIFLINLILEPLV